MTHNPSRSPFAYHHSRGFTIVELLIVIVVIAILAAITIVAYNGIQQRSRNTTTITAVTAWVKALKLYYADNGSWPPNTSCIGAVGSYDGDGKCWSTGSFLVNATTVSQVEHYMNGSAPTPDLSVVDTGSYTIRGGRYDAGSHSVFFVLSGGTSKCPSIGNLRPVYNAPYSNGTQCGVEL